MDYKLFNMGNYNLYLMKTKKFKTISLSIRFKKEKDREDAVYCSILKEVLKTGTNKYGDIDDYYKALLNIYNPNIIIDTANYGKDRTFFINSIFANEKYTEKGMNQQTLEFIFDMIYNPKITNQEFETKTFDTCKHEYIEYLKAAKDNPFKYAADRAWEEMDIYDFKLLTVEEAIKVAEKISSKDLYNYYKKLFTDNSLDIFVVGDFEFEKIKNIISKIVKGDFQISEKNRCIIYNEASKKPKQIVESVKTNQSQLSIGFKFKNLTDFERKYVSVFYTAILGGGWSSKLFQTVREKNSLCYHISASRSISHSIFFIYSSIEASNFKKVLKLIDEEIENMKNGKFTLDDMQQVKQIYTNSLLEIEDSQILVVNNLIDMVMSNSDSISERKKNIEKVTAEDIINLAKKVNKEVVYLLKGELDEKN